MQSVLRSPLTWHTVGRFNPLDCKGNYSATSNNMKLVNWRLMGGLLHLVQLGGAWVGCGPAIPPRGTKCNSPPIRASVSITLSLYDGPLLCGFNVAIKELNYRLYHVRDWCSQVLWTSRADFCFLFSRSNYRLQRSDVRLLCVISIFQLIYWLCTELRSWRLFCHFEASPFVLCRLTFVKFSPTTFFPKVRCENAIIHVLTVTADGWHCIGPSLLVVYCPATTQRQLRKQKVQ